MSENIGPIATASRNVNGVLKRKEIIVRNIIWERVILANTQTQAIEDIMKNFQAILVVRLQTATTNNRGHARLFMVLTIVEIFHGVLLLLARSMTKLARFELALRLTVFLRVGEVMHVFRK